MKEIILIIIQFSFSLRNVYGIPFLGKDDNFSDGIFNRAVSYETLPEFNKWNSNGQPLAGIDLILDNEVEYYCFKVNTSPEYIFLKRNRTVYLIDNSRIFE